MTLLGAYQASSDVMFCKLFVCTQLFRPLLIYNSTPVAVAES